MKSTPLLTRARAIASGSLTATLLDQALVSGSNFFATIVIARALGPTQFGQFSFAYMAILLASLIQSCGFLYPMLTLAPRLATAPLYFNKAFSTALLTAAGALVGFGVVLPLLDSLSFKVGFAPLALPLAVAGSAFLLQDYFRRYFFANARRTAALICDAISYGSQLLILVVLAALAELGISNALWTIAATSVCACIYGFAASTHKRPAFNELKRFWRRHWDSGKWLTVSGGSQWVASQGLMFWAGAALGSAALGGSRVIFGISGPALLVLQALQNYLPQRASSTLMNKGDFELRRMLLRALRLLLLAFLLFGLALALLGPILIPAIFGLPYGRFSRFLYVHAAYLAISAAVFIANIYHRTKEEAWRAAKAQLISMPVALVVFGLLNRGLGLWALFLAMVAGQGMSALILLPPLFIRSRQQRPTEPLPTNST